VIKKWPDDVCIGCDGVNKPMNMIFESIIIEEKNEFIEE